MDAENGKSGIGSVLTNISSIDMDIIGVVSKRKLDYIFIFVFGRKGDLKIEGLHNLLP